MLITFRSFVKDTFFALSRPFQAVISCNLYSWLNGPEYEMNPQARRVSPINRPIWSFKCLLVTVHLSFSPVSPLINVLAAVIFRLQLSAWSASLCFSLTAPQYISWHDFNDLSFLLSFFSAVSNSF